MKNFQLIHKKKCSLQKNYVCIRQFLVFILKKLKTVTFRKIWKSFSILKVKNLFILFLEIYVEMFFLQKIVNVK